MKTVKSSIIYKEKAPRLELLIRIIYAIPVVIVLWIFGVIVAIVQFVLWFYILIFGKRHKGMSNFIKTYVIYLFRINSYFHLLTDERPPIIPEEN